MIFERGTLVDLFNRERITACDVLVGLPDPEPANDDGKCRCMCLDCEVDLHMLCDNGTCLGDSWQRYLR